MDNLPQEKSNFKSRLMRLLTREHLVKLLKQPSTHRAIIVLCGLAGYALDPTLLEQCIQGAIAAVALYEAFRDENKQN